MASVIKALLPDGHAPSVLKQEILDLIKEHSPKSVPGESSPPGSLPAPSVPSPANARRVDVTAAPYNADPSGSRDSTRAIQDAIDAASQAGGGTVVIPSGIYKVSHPFIELKGMVQVVGDGRGTQIIATGSVPGDEPVGVFHTGSWNVRKQDSGLIHFGLSDVWIRALLPGIQHQTPITNTVGVLLNTDIGDKPAEPDAVPTLNNVTVWDMDYGVAILGRDDQAMDVWNLKIRNTQRAGLTVGKPPEHPELKANVPGGPGGADNQFFGLNVGGANKLRGNYAGVEVYTSQCTFSHGRSWYTHRGATWQEIYGQPANSPAGRDEDGGAPQKANRANQKNGAGWYIYGTKCIFIGCLAQESGGHGFLLMRGENQIIGCRAESSSYSDTAGATPAEKQEREGDAADFYIANEGADGTLLLGCMSQKVGNRGKGARYSYYVEAWYRGLEISHCRSIGNANPVRCEKSPQGNAIHVQVDDYVFTNRPPKALAPEGVAKALGFWPVTGASAPTETTKYGVPVVWVKPATAESAPAPGNPGAAS